MKLPDLLPHMTSQQEIHEAVEGFLEAGWKAYRAGNFDEAVKKLKRRMSKLKFLAETYTELWLQLTASLAQLCCEAGQWKDTISLCMDAKSVWISLPIFESFCVLYCLLQSHYYLGSSYEGLEIITQWTEQVKVHSPRSQCVLFLIKAFQLFEKENLTEAATCYEQALAVDVDLHPHVYLIACSRLYLGTIYESTSRPELANDQFNSARLLLSAQYPHSIGLAISLVSLGRVNHNCLQLPMQAENLYAEAAQMYAARFPKSLHYVECLANQGILYDSLNRDREAEAAWLKAVEICAESYPTSIEWPGCLLNLGWLYQHTKHQPKKAENYYAQASALFAAHHPLSLDYAQCLLNWGLLSFDRDEFEAAEQHWLCASQICADTDPQGLFMAHCKRNLGTIYREDQPDIAEEHCEQAIAIYEMKSPQSLDLAKCYCALARLYEGKNSLTQAEELYLKAQIILKQHFPQSEDRALMLLALGWLYQNFLSRVDQAELLFLEAKDLFAAFPPSPDFAQCLVNLGLIYDSRNSLDLAEIEWLHSAYLCSAYFPLAAHFPNSLYDLGLLYQSKGEYQRADSMFEKAFKRYNTADQQLNCIILLRDQYI
jgi:hypothetical protein